MHRITPATCTFLATALLGLAAFHGLGTTRAAAQDRAPIVAVPINGSQILEMSKKQRIKDIDNKDQNVVRVDFVQGSDFRKVMVIGGSAAGLSRLVLTDANGNREAFDIVVEQNLEFLRRVLSQAVPTANLQIIQGTGNTLVLTGTVAQATDIDIILRTAWATGVGKDNVVNAMRIGGVQQVQLDVVIARVARSEARNLGISFLQNGGSHFISNSLQPGNLTSTLTNSLGNVTSTLTGSPNAIVGLFNNHEAFLGFLEALRTDNLVKVIAQPKICTLSGRPAEFLSGGEQAVPVLASGGAGGGAVSGVDFKPFGTTVRFLPLVLGGGKIYLEVEPQFTFPDPSNLFSAPIPGTNSVVFGRDTQRVQTSAVLEDGQTMAIGGMIFHQVNGTATKVPVLGDLPWVGALFRTMNYSDSEEELLILITPHLVDAMACNQLPRCLPGEETRKPDDYELFLEGILEAPRGPRQVWQDHKYVPAYKNSPTAGMYPCPACENGLRGACDIGNTGASPTCLYDGGCANGSCGNGSCPTGGCQPGSFGQGLGAGSFGQPLGNGPGKSQPNPAPVQSMVPGPQTSGMLAPQQLPEMRTHYEVQVETVPVETVPRLAAQAPGQQVQQVSGSGVTLIAPTALNNGR